MRTVAYVLVVAALTLGAASSGEAGPVLDEAQTPRPGPVTGVDIVTTRHHVEGPEGHPAATCRVGDVVVSNGRWREPATQQWVAEFQVTNIGRAPCRLKGYPTGGILDSEGNVAVPLSRHGGVQLRGQRPWNVRLAPGWSAFFGLNESRCQGPSHESHKAQIHLPRQHGTFTVHIPFIAYCGKRDITQGIVAVSPLRRTLNAVFRL